MMPLAKMLTRVVANVRSTCGHWTHVFGVKPAWVKWLQEGLCATCELHEEIREKPAKEPDRK